MLPGVDEVHLLQTYLVNVSLEHHRSLEPQFMAYCNHLTVLKAGSFSQSN